MVGRRAGGMQDFQKSADGLLNAFLVASLDRCPESDAFVDLLISIGMFELIVKCLGQVVGDESVIVRQEFAAVLRHFPAGDKCREPVHDGKIKFGGQRLKEVVLGRVHHLRHRQVDVADETQASVGDHLGSARKASIRHEILHDLDRILIANLDPANLVKSHRIPVSDQTDFAPRIVVEKSGLRRLATGDQSRVGGKLAEEV